jgi:uncharacterized 2Fe-2S/4Fe-4S cluster protein (DUF4445 family)
MADFSVRFLPGGRSIAVPEGTPVLEAAAAAGLPLRSPCGGRGLCGKCAVQVASGADQPQPEEQRVFTEQELADGWRLACQARIIADAEVTVPSSSLVVEHQVTIEGISRKVAAAPNIRKIPLRLPTPSPEDPRADLNRVLDALGRHIRAPRSLGALRALPGALRSAGCEVTAVTAGDSLIAVEPGDTSDLAYGAAVDIGTTTVVAYLCHLPTGKLAAVAADLNPQARYGADVISRLQTAVGGEDGTDRLCRAVVGLVDDLVGRAVQEAGVPRESVYEIAVVGNTCMTHFFLGIPPTGLAAAPFVPAFRSSRVVRAADLGIAVHPEAQVFVAPNIGSYVGADTVGVILASELDRTDGITVAVDIGTNGEIVVATEGRMYACSTAAGPAFEGARISRGMRAAAGAIDAAAIAADVEYHVIGDAPPRGLCGSGLVDVVAELVEVGAIAESGRMRRPDELPSDREKVRRRLIENEDGMQFVLARGDETEDGKPLSVTARDVREVQLAKAAIYAGMELLLAELGAVPGDIDGLLLAGAFGNYIRRESAIRIGLIPTLDLDRVKSIGNAAGVGARLVLASAAERRRAEQIAQRVNHVSLSESDGFYERFAEAMTLRPLPQPA